MTKKGKQFWNNIIVSQTVGSIQFANLVLNILAHFSLKKKLLTLNQSNFFVKMMVHLINYFNGAVLFLFLDLKDTTHLKKFTTQPATTFTALTFFYLGHSSHKK